MTIGSLFSGIGGLELGLEWAGLGPVVWQVEREPFCRNVLSKRWPNAKRFADVASVGRSDLAAVDLIAGGFPCQDISLMGKGWGLAGARSGLWFEYARIVDAIRPRFVVVENVAALVGRGLDKIVDDLERLGYAVHGRIIAAGDVGAPHRRERLFLVGVADSDRVGCEGVASSDGEERGLGLALGDDAARRGAGMVSDETRPRATQSRLGGGSHGLPDRVDRWPSRPGNPSAVWEPPRSLTAYSPTRNARLRALGNAVVPQCAEVVGRLIAAMSKGEVS